MDRLYIKSVCVGFEGVGKTTLLITFYTGACPEGYIPTVFDNWAKDVEIDGRLCQLGLYDTGGGIDYPRLRPLSYPQTDVFILLFDVSDSEERFKEIHSYWWHELHHHCPDTPIILVAPKIDLRNKDGKKTISQEKGQAMADKIKAINYFEVSSFDNCGVTELFEEVMIQGLQHHSSVKDKKKKKCTIF